MATKPSKERIMFLLFFAASITALHDVFAIFIAKSLNSVVSQSMTPHLACSETPAGGGRDLLRQALVCLLFSAVVMQVWFQCTLKTTKIGATTKFMFGEILGWSFKEITVIILVMMVKTFSVSNDSVSNDSDEEDPVRLLRDHLQSDASFEERNGWFHLIAYCIYSVVLGIISYILFVPALPLIKTIYWHITTFFIKKHKHRMKLCRKIDDGVQDLVGGEKSNEQNNEGRQENGLEQGCEEEEKENANEEKPNEEEEEEEEEEELISREESDDLAFEFTNECIRVSFAYCVNGIFAGTIVMLFVKEYSEEKEEIVTSAFGILEVYSILAIILLGSIYGATDEDRDEPEETIEGQEENREEPEEEESALRKYYREFLGTWAGFSIASVGTSPAGISVHIQNSALPKQLTSFFRALLAATFAIWMIAVSTRIRVKNKLFCFKINTKIAREIGQIMTSAAIVAFAVAWEEFYGDLACSFADTSDESIKEGLTPIQLMWVFFIASLFFFPISRKLERIGSERMSDAEKKLLNFMEEEDEANQHQ